MASATFNPSARDKGAEALKKAEDAGAEAFDAAKQAGAEGFSKIKDAGAEGFGKAREAVGSVGEMAAETACAVGKKADDLTAAAGHEIKEFGETVAKKTPHEGVAGHAAQSVAETIKGSGKYIEEAKLSGMAHDVEQVIKTHPIPALLICFGVGFCIGRAMKD
jgi:hypothetical protein